MRSLEDRTGQSDRDPWEPGTRTGGRPGDGMFKMRPFAGAPKWEARGGGGRQEHGGPGGTVHLCLCLPSAQNQIWVILDIC